MRALVRLAALLALVAHGPAVGAAARPTAAVDAQVQAYLAAVNGEGDAAAKALYARAAPSFTEMVPPSAFVDYFANQRRVTGGVELVDLRMKDERTVELVVKDRIYGALHGQTLEFDGTPEARISAFEPGAAPLWASTPKRVLAPREVGVRAARLVERGCEAGVFSGAVLVARGRDVLVETACGQANRRYGVRNSANTRFNLGSMNKMFTAVAVMQLVESGRVSLDDPLSKYADASWLAPDVSGKITIRHLLAHTSGLGSFLNKEFDKSSRRLFRNLDDYKPLVRGETPAFEPGTKFRYSNTGMLLLGVVVEQASGKTYFDYVQAHIFDPAGMTASGSWPMDEPVPDLAMGYIWAPGTAYGWRENTLAHVFRGSPAGGGYSTVGDLHRFATALQAGRLLRPGSVEFLWTDNPPNLYGRGFEINASAAGKVVGHSGVYSGISSRLDIYVERGYVVAILGNQDQAAPGLAAAIQGVISEAR